METIHINCYVLSQLNATLVFNIKMKDKSLVEAFTQIKQHNTFQKNVKYYAVKIICPSIINELKSRWPILTHFRLQFECFLPAANYTLSSFVSFNSVNILCNHNHNRGVHFRTFLISLSVSLFLFPLSLSLSLFACLSLFISPSPGNTLNLTYENGMGI